MTFLMSADGLIFERDLGLDVTPTAGVTIFTFDPAPGWTRTRN